MLHFALCFKCLMEMAQLVIPYHSHSGIRSSVSSTLRVTKKNGTHTQREDGCPSGVKNNLPQLGIEPSAIPWEGIMLPLHH
jgi:hypothetical protein